MNEILQKEIIKINVICIYFTEVIPLFNKKMKKSHGTVRDFKALARDSLAYAYEDY